MDKITQAIEIIGTATLDLELGLPEYATTYKELIKAEKLLLKVRDGFDKFLNSEIKQAQREYDLSAKDKWGNRNLDYDEAWLECLEFIQNKIERGL